MQAELNTGKGLARSLNITVPAAKVAEHFTRRIAALSKNVKIDGFRPGKVPAKVVKERLGDQVAQDVARELVEECLPQAINEHKLNVAGQPRVHNNGPTEGFKAQEGTDFTFIADLEIYPEVKPEGFSGLKLTREVAEPSDELVSGALTRLQSQMQSFAEKKGKAEKGDRITVTGQGYADKKAFDGGNLKDFTIVLGAGQVIPGFEDGLIGTKAGDEVEVNVTFPAEYHAKELAGKPATFKLTVSKVEGPKDEELNDESVKKMGFENLSALKDILKSGAVRDLTNASEQRLKRALLDALEKSNSKFELPQVLVEAEHQALWRAQLQELQQRNLPIEALGSSVEDAIASLRPLAERRVRLGLTLAAIARENKIEVTTEDLDAAIAAQIEGAGPQAEQARRYFANPQNRQQLLGPILEDKVTKWVLDQAEVKEKKVEAQELLAELQ
ncbi:MAG: trigger factor [Proteobacteria bacterium]|nr:trigger factor [Pseudomonadota bacterium]